MDFTRRAAALTLLGALIAGCQTTRSTEAPSATPDQVTTLRAKYEALPGALVGQVDAANETFAIVSGIDPKAIGKNDVLSFIDPATDAVVNHGALYETRPNGMIVLRFDTQGQRVPRVGDLVVRLK